MEQKKNNSPQEGLFIPSRHVAAYTSLALSLCGAIFMGGYFLGKQHMVDQLVSQIEHDSFADHISASLCALYDDELDTSYYAEMQEEVAPQSVELPEIVADASEEKIADTPEQDSEKYYAQLIGYGTRKAAEQFADKLQKKGMPVCVKQRHSKTAQGKERDWFQVVTEPLADQNALQELTQRIAKEEKIAGIQVVSC